MTFQRSISSIWRYFGEIRWRLIRARFAINLENPIIMKPFYAEDGLITSHIPVFYEDEKFMDSYRKGVATGALNFHRGQITWRSYINAKLAQKALTVPGDFVECGVGHGLYSLTICNYLNFADEKKKFTLIDTFEGIPMNQLDPTEYETARRFNSRSYQGDYFEEVKQNFSPFPNVQLHKGVLPQILDRITFSTGIAYLQIDLNNANAEKAVLERLLPLCTKGSVVVLDDFGYGPEFETSRRMISSYAIENDLEIIVLPTGQGLIFP